MSPGGATSISLELENACDLHGSCLALAGGQQSHFCRKPGQGNSTYEQDRGAAVGLRSAGRTRTLGSAGTYLGIAAITWGLVLWVQVGAWTYHYSDQGDYTWEQARNYCQTFFTDLVAIQNQQEIQYLNRSLPYHRHYYWIGIRKLGGVWTWVGTRKALTKEAENWAQGEPNNRRSNQDCVEIYIQRPQQAGKWNDEPCSRRKKALCYRASCQPFPCSQRGECVETIGSYRCQCQPGFHGPECADVVQCARLEPEGVPMNCSHPYGDFSYNSTCEFSCHEGFERQGVGVLRCLPSQQWSASIPTCTAITCPVLRAPAQGELNCSHLHGDFTFGSTCAFSCQKGFALVGPESRECTATGTWTGDTPRCEAIACPVLSAPAQGEMHCSHLHGNFTFGSTCAFSCRKGFALVGLQSHECTATGSWTGDTPHCEAVACPVLRAPAQGELNCSHLHGDFTFGSTCAFSCQTGFVLVGPESRECTATGTWTGNATRCAAITCPVLRAPAQGEMHCSHLHGNFTFGSTCAFSCQKGFVLMGLQSHECTATGTWTGDTPHCEAITCPVLRAPAQGELNCSHLHGDFTFGSTCAFSCQKGFVLMGPDSLKCRATGTWTGDAPHCEAIKCSALTTPKMGQAACSHLHGDFTFGSTCAFSCQKGFVLMGPESRECTATGTWTGDTPHCKAISCPELSPPSRGQLSCSHLHGNFTYNSTCSFSCEQGFVRVGAELLRCQPTGNWSRDAPVCAEDGAFLKQVLAYSSGSALAVAGVVLSGGLIALLVKRLSDREEKRKLLKPTSDLGAPGTFTNTAYDGNL
ncbi:P-selectin isoform X5 [Oenanthe melanoleuca]|uniref:P-selectin isoform X5 n=1 Tax=Oenanthe melanoleuca TaxID=2939378 RepID=UPI0024C1FF21|nr:P-selectin isoform X5 [Oenanthe melanoleuca]